jgi:thiol-disulfide isomerase/thioredoxin
MRLARHGCRLFLGAIAWVLIGSTALATGQLKPGSGEPAPPLVLRDLDGNEVRLASFRGRTVVVNFWATWCAPCVAEMPSLERLRERFRSEGLEVLAVNLQENAARIRPFAERLGLSMPILRDHDGSARTSWGVGVFPTTFVVGPGQELALVAVGEIDWDAPRVVERIAAVVARPAATPKNRQADIGEGRGSPHFLLLPPRRSPWIAAVS